jgi:hypothetical protein
MWVGRKAVSFEAGHFQAFEKNGMARTRWHNVTTLADSRATAPT